MPYPLTRSKEICHDDFTTPKSAWSDIKDFLPKDKVIWEPFYCNGSSGKFLEELGFTVIHRPNEDFFENNHGDIIVSNPPFSKKKEVLEQLKKINKPFVLILPHFTLTTQYFQDLFFKDKIQIIVPRRRINFVKIVDGKPIDSKTSCSFDCLYFCYNMSLKKDINFIQ